MESRINDIIMKMQHSALTQKYSKIMKTEFYQ